MKKSAKNWEISWFYHRFVMSLSRAFQRGITRLCSIKNKKRLKKYSVCICCIRLNTSLIFSNFWRYKGVRYLVGKLLTCTFRIFHKISWFFHFQLIFTLNKFYFFPYSNVLNYFWQLLLYIFFDIELFWYQKY